MSALLLYSHQAFSASSEEIRHTLECHSSRVVSRQEHQRINVRRQFLLKDAMAAFQRQSFDVSKLLRVCFLGEAAVDTGGPRREFLQLMMVELLSEPSLFEGYPSCVTLTHNVLALSSGKFALAGKMIATSIVQVWCIVLLFVCIYLHPCQMNVLCYKAYVHTHGECYILSYRVVQAHIVLMVLLLMCLCMER